MWNPYLNEIQKTYRIFFRGYVLSGVDEFESAFLKFNEVTKLFAFNILINPIVLRQYAKYALGNKHNRPESNLNVKDIKK